LIRRTLEQARARIPHSGRLFWGMGVVPAVEGQVEEAERYLKESVDLLPEWPASYSALGVLYYEAGQMNKVRQTLKEFKENGPPGTLEVSRIEQVLSAAPTGNPAKGKVPVSPPRARQQSLQTAPALASL
jgi:tetratricopeptide (TPR) repeat protein